MAQRGTKLPAATYLPLWDRALEEEIGILIRCTDRLKLAQALYEAKAKSLNPAYADLMLFQPAEDLIYIAKKAVELDA
jgi:hypothetical protein